MNRIRSGSQYLWAALEKRVSLAKPLKDKTAKPLAALGALLRVVVGIP